MKYLSKLKLTQKTLVLMSIGLMSQLTHADIVQNDDVIVEGSECVSDSDLCASGESFLPPDSVSITDFKVKDGTPNIWFNDTDAGASDWTITIDNANTAAGGGGAESFGIWNQESNTTSFIIENGVSTRGMLTIDAGEKIGVGTTTPGETLEIASAQPGFRLNDTDAGQADIEVDGNFLVMQNTANTKVVNMEINGGVTQANQLYFDSDGDIGIQVANPLRDLEVGGDSTIRLVDEQQSWDLGGTDDFVFNMIQGGVTKSIMTFENDDSPCTGAGGTEVAPCVGFFEAGNPDASVHIRKTDGTTQFLVEEGSATTAVRSLIKMKNKGAVGFLMEDTSVPVEWEFRSNGSSNFIMNDIGDAAEVTVLRNGNMIVQGSINANGIALTSSRSAKTDFMPIKANDVMQKLAKITLEEWRYKEADKGDRHISPMAEDFYSLFKLGPDNKHINPNDLASVAIIAAKELQKKSDATNAKLEAETVALKAENIKLQKRLASLEKLVTNLASANGHLGLSGEKVATAK